MLNLYRISQNQNQGYDTYDSAIVAAKSEDEARRIHPSAYVKTKKEWEKSTTWVKEPILVKVKLIGVATEDVKKGVVLASFNAG